MRYREILVGKAGALPWEPHLASRKAADGAERKAEVARRTPDAEVRYPQRVRRPKADR